MRNLREPNRRGSPFPVLLYHSVNDTPPVGQELFTVSPRAFAAQIAAITDSGFTTIDLETLAARLKTGAELPGRTVAISFDDGYADLRETALEILTEHGMTATLFQTTSCIGGSYGGARMLTASTLRELAAAGTRIGSHTATHPHLDLVPAPVLREELGSSRDRLEQILGHPVDSIAYPHGSFRASVVRAAAAAGYSWGAAVKNAYTHADDDPWAIARITMTARHSAADLPPLLAGAAAPLAWRRERLRTTVFRQVRRFRTDGGHDRATG